MAEKNSYAGTLSNLDWARISTLCARPFVEIYFGLLSGSLNWFVCITPGLIANLMLLLRVDAFLWRKIGISFLPPHGAKGYFIYLGLSSFSGFLIWGIWQTILSVRVSRRLTEVFQTSGLKNAIGKLPSFVFDRPIDEFTRKMRLTRANLPASQFIQAKESLESALQVYVDEIKENREHGTIDITYASQSIPEQVKPLQVEAIERNSVFIGETRAKKIFFNFEEMPHMLVGGQSGGGKSTFLRQLITTLYLSGKNNQFYLVDLKGGLEFQTFENLPRVSVIPQASTALDTLVTLEESLEERIGLFKAAGVKDIDAYLALPEEKRNEVEIKQGSPGRISRVFTVIDEAAELFLAGGRSNAESTQKAKRLAIKIAAQGRAVGLHLIIATQRPDVKAVDGQIKVNLSGKLAFQMPNHASSMTILDNTRAASLPRIPGRAIWKTGLEMVELQTPFMTVAHAEELLKPFRRESNAERKR